MSGIKVQPCLVVPCRSLVIFTIGVHTVTLTVTDDGGVSSSDDMVVTVTEAASTNTMHVDSINMNLVSRWRGWDYYAVATPNVVDSEGNPVGGAVVSGRLEGATSLPLIVILARRMLLGK